MADPEERTLGPAAIDHIRKRLDTGKSFANALLVTLPLERGSVITYLPSAVSDDDAERFSSGGKFPVDASKTQHYTDSQGRRIHLARVPDDALPWAEARIRQHLESTGSAVCVIEDLIKEPTDRFWVTNPPIHVVPTFVGDEVYYAAFASDSLEFLDQAMRHAGGAWPGVLAALTSIDANDPIAGDRAIEPHQWRGLAERTVGLIIGAYDAEGYLVWSAPPS